MTSDLNAIPAELRALPHWVLYRLRRRKDKVTKEPYQAAHAGRRASTTDPDTWGTFEAAIAARERGRGDGIGFVFSESDPYAGVDLDDCIRDGVLDDRARPVIEQLVSYTELSPSGTGLHVIGCAEVGGGRSTDDTPWGGKFELYDRARFFTITGVPFDGLPSTIVDFAAGLAVVRGELLPEALPPASSNGQANSAAAEFSDRELLKRAFAAKNGAKFQALWRGDRSGYGSESESDQALCSMLAFWTGPDEARIDRLFQSSAFMRPKWDRATYRDATIRKALSGRTEFYSRTPATTRSPKSPVEVINAAWKIADSDPVVAGTAIGIGLDAIVHLSRVSGARIRLRRLGDLYTAPKHVAQVSVALPGVVVPDLSKPAAVRVAQAIGELCGVNDTDEDDHDEIEGWLGAFVSGLGATIEGDLLGVGEPRWRVLVEQRDYKPDTTAHGLAAATAAVHDLDGRLWLPAEAFQRFVARVEGVSLTSGNLRARLTELGWRRLLLDVHEPGTGRPKSARHICAVFYGEPDA